MPEITLYSTMFCPYCMRAKRLLKGKGVSWEEIKVDGRKAWKDLEKRTGRNTVPQIFIGETHVGGFDDLARLDSQGKLDELLRS